MASNPFDSIDPGIAAGSTNPFDDPNFSGTQEPGLIDRLKQGAKNTAAAAQISATDDPEAISTLIADAAKSRAPASAVQRKMAEEYAPYAKRASEAEGVVDNITSYGSAIAKRVGQFASNPKEFAGMVAENLPNSAPGMAGGLLGAAVGGSAGSALPGVGNAVGAVVGGVVGGTAGGYAIEQGSAMQELVQKEAQARGIDLQDKAGMTSLVAEKYPEFLKMSRLKGVGTAGTDAILNAATFGLAGAGERVLAKEARALEAGIRSGAVDATTGAAQLAELEAKNAARNTLGAKALRGAGVTSSEMVGEGLSEGVGQKLGYGQVDAGEVIDEGLLGFGTGVGMAAGHKAVERIAGEKPGQVEESLARSKFALEAPARDAATVNAAIDETGAALTDYEGLLPDQRQIGFDPAVQNVIQVPAQTPSGNTNLVRGTGALTDAVIDHLENISPEDAQTLGGVYKAYYNKLDAESALASMPDGDRYRIVVHPKSSVPGALAVVPKPADVLAAQDAKAAAQAAAQTRTLQVEQEDGNAAEPLAPGLVTFAGQDVSGMQSPNGARVVNHFTTAQGSEYVQTADGMTQRNKSVHANTGGADAGVHGWNDSAVFIDPANEVATNAPFGITVQRLQEAGHRLAIQQRDGVIAALLYDNNTKSWRVATTMDAFPAAVQSGLFTGQEQVAAPYTDTPTVGHDVFEYTNRPDGRGVSSVHAGSPVASVTPVGLQNPKAPASAAQTTAQVQQQEAAQEDLQPAPVQPVAEMPGPANMSAKMAEAARLAAQQRAAKLAAEEASAPVSPQPKAPSEPKASQTKQSQPQAQATEADDAQSEIAQSTGKMSFPRVERLKGESNADYQYRLAAAAQARKTANNTATTPKTMPTASSDLQAAVTALGSRATGNEEVVAVADMPDIKAAGKNEISQQMAKHIGQVARVFGKRVVFVKGMATDGMRTAGNTIYLSTNSSVAHLRVLGHELLHALKAQKGDAYAKLLGAVKGLLTDAVYAAEYENYHGTAMPEGAQLSESEKSFLAEEWLGDLSGNRFTEADFWNDVFGQLEAQYGAPAAKGIIARLRLALVNALNQLLKLVSGPAFAADRTVAGHLTEVRKALADGFAQYAQAVKTGELDSEAGVSGDAKFSAAKPEASIQHQMEITREDRELAASTRLSSAEQNVIGLEAKRIKVTKAELEREVRRIKAQFPTSGGWAPIEFDKVNKAKYAKKGVLSMDTVEFKKQPYNFHLGVTGKDDGATHNKRVTAVAKGISDEIVSLAAKAANGDQNAKITMDQIGWYSKVATMLHHQFGGFADFLAQLMGPTSANTPVEGNVKYAMAALKSAMSGKWDSLIADTIRWHEGVMQAAAGLDAVIAANRAKPKADRLNAKDLAQTQAFKDAMAAIEAAAPYRGEEPQQDSGAKFGMATQGVVEILANTWSDFQRGDAPKTKNYYQNLIGRQFTGATIDVWAARTLRRMAGLNRIPTSAEKGVAGKIGVDLTPGAEFGFGQEAFTKAAENLRNSGIPEFANTTPADVQAMIWFSEKENWARNNWTNKIGEGGSAEAEFNLQGNEDREGLEEARRLSRKGLPHVGNTKPNKTEEKAQQASVDAGVGQFPDAKDTPQYKERLAKIIAKAVQARNEARVQFEAMRGTVDRWIAGVTPATDFTPSDETMAEVGAELESKVAMGEDAHKVLAFKALPTMGRYGYDERSIDFEGVTRQGYNGTDMLTPLLEIAKEHAQDGLLFGRVLRADEEIDYLRHRPGMELYLARGTTMEKAQPLLDKLDQLGFKQFTFVVDPVRTPEALSGKMGNVVGLRYIFTPEFSLREPNPEYGGDQTWSPGSLTDDQIRDRMVAKSAELDLLADQLRGVSGVSSAELRDYEANVYFWGDYDNALGSIASQPGQRAEGQQWLGNSIRSGLEGADRRREMDPGSEDAKSFADRRDVLRGDAKLSTKRTGTPALIDGQGGSGARPNAVSITGVHFSQHVRTNLDGRFNGTGLKGAERTRLANSTDPRIKERVYFYVDEGNGIRPESGVGGVAHAASLGNLYNVKGDPEGLFKSRDDNANESALLDAGYDGYYVPKVFNNQGVAVVLGKASRGIAVAPTGYEKGKAPQAAPEPYKRALMGSELSKLDMEALKAAAPSAKLRMGNLTMDAAELPAARSELAKQGIDLPEAKLSTKREPFYSALSAEVGKLKLNAAPSFGWRDAIKGLINKGQVKAEEVEWTGLGDWIELQTGKVTKEQVQQYLDQNGVRVEETTLGAKADLEKLNAKIEPEGYTAYEDRIEHTTYFVDEDGDHLDYADLPEYIQKIVDKHQPAAGVGPAKFGQYVVPGGENYREVLLKLPHADVNIAAEIEQKTKRLAAFREMQASELSGADKYKAKGDALEAQLVELRKLPRQMLSDNYTSSHWDQKNVLAHLRLDDRTDADGKKVLFVNELQSDWGQQGKREGFHVEPDFEGKIKEMDDKQREWFKVSSGVMMLSGNVWGWMPSRAAAEAELRHQNRHGIPTAPFVTKTEGWLNLALKRVIKMAVDGGYDKVAFANGEQNAGHYDLSKQVDSIYITKLKKGGFEFTARRDGQEVVSREHVADSSALAAAIGKDLAEKADTQELDTGKSYSGLDLKIGGEGMKTFYDKIVPIAAGKLSQKLGGGKVEMVHFGKELKTLTSQGEYRVVDQNGDLWNTTRDRADADKYIASMKGKLDLHIEGRDAEYEKTNPQPGITITDKMRESAAGGLPLFSKKRIVGDTQDYTPDVLAVMDKLGWRVEDKSLKERMQDLWKDAGKKLAQGIADQFAPVKDVDGKAYGLLRLAKGAAGAFETVLRGGMLKLSDNVYDIDTTKRGGFVDRVLMPLQGEHSNFLRWVAAQRANQLKQVGKENLFDQSDIDTINKWANTSSVNFDYKIQHGIRKGKTTRNRAEIFRDSNVTFNEFNKNVLDMAEQSGLIDGATRHLWENEFYVPFYRVAEESDGGVRGMNIKGAAVRQQAFKALKGGKDKLNADLLDNTLMNWSHLLDAAAKNRAAKATIEAAEKVGIAMGGNQSALASMGSTVGNKNGVVWFMDGGQKRYSLIDNQGDGPYIMTALSSLEYAGMRNPAMNAMGAMKHALTVGVTASPFFKVRNLIRDSVQVVGTGNISYNVGKNLTTGWKLTDPKSDAYFRLLAGGGTIHFGSMMEGSEAKRVHDLVASGVDSAAILDSDNKVKAMYQKSGLQTLVRMYGELGDRGEALNRAALYDQLRKQGLSHADASLQARDLMDFSMQGSWTGIRFLTQVVPFMNARIQGLYKLGKAAKEDPARFGIVLGATALASLALLAAYHDDDDWKKRTDMDRNNFWWFKIGGTAYRIPKPFEIGSIGTLAERGFEAMFDKEMSGERLLKQVVSVLGDNLSMNPIPQLVKPLLDVYANKNALTGNPIENLAQQKLKSEYRFNDKTTMTARALGTANNAVTGLIGKEGLSPVQIDALLHGYFGWLGATVVSGADYLARPASGQPDQARGDWMKTVTGNIASDLRDAPSRYVGQMYEQAKVNMEAYDTWHALLKQQKPEEAKAFFDKNKKDILAFHQTEAAKKSETLFNNMMRMVERNTTLDPDQKREKIRAIQAQKEVVAKRAVLAATQ